MSEAAITTEATRLVGSPQPDGAGEVLSNGWKGLKGLVSCSYHCPFACICFPCAMQKEQRTACCTPNLFTWMSEGGWLAAQTAWRKDNTIKGGFPACLSALVCTPCYLAYLLDEKKKYNTVMPVTEQGGGPRTVGSQSLTGQGSDGPGLVDGQPGMIRF